MPRYKFTSEAKADLQHIIDESDRSFGKQQRLKYIRGLQEKAKNLAERPAAGKKHDDLIKGLRSAQYVNHIVYYVPQDQGIAITQAHGCTPEFPFQNLNTLLPKCSVTEQ